MKLLDRLGFKVKKMKSFLYLTQEDDQDGGNGHRQLASDNADKFTTLFCFRHSSKVEKWLKLRPPPGIWYLTNDFHDIFLLLYCWSSRVLILFKIKMDSLFLSVYIA